jgi:peptidoglycan/xylan/chitin deacetylase (PgdA/CDA1 family)
MRLCAGPDTVYDIRGDSPQLDANMTVALHAWREETITPIRNGLYANVIVNGDSRRPNVSITFDDSPDENNTDQILDVLKHYGVKAAFFMIGQPMQENNATVVKRAVQEGHLVLNHSFTHPHLTDRTPEEIVRELNATSERIFELTGNYPHLMRPPYGAVSTAVVDAINAQGFTSVLWSLDSLDWAIRDKDEIIRNVLGNVRPGDIILMHGSRSNHATVEALPEIIEGLRNKGYTFVSLDEMVSRVPYR